MRYLIDHKNQFTETYSKEQVQSFIDDGKISPYTLIWTESWGEWKSVFESDFNLQHASNVSSQTNNQRMRRDSSDAISSLLVGLGMMGIGGLITYVTYSAASEVGGHYVVTSGLLFGGAIYFLRGLIKLMLN